MELKWLIECDNVSIGTTGSTFLAVEEDVSIGSFPYRCSRDEDDIYIVSLASRSIRVSPNIVSFK